MKLLTILIAVIFSVVIIAFSTAYACSVSASAYATAGNNAYASSSVSANGTRRGGYSLTCTGQSSKSASFSGGTSDSLSSYFSHRAAVSASASIGGSCPGGGGVQDYDYAQAP